MTIVLLHGNPETDVVRNREYASLDGPVRQPPSVVSIWSPTIPRRVTARFRPSVVRLGAAVDLWSVHFYWHAAVFSPQE